MKRIYQPFFVQVFFILPSAIDTIRIQTVKRTAYITKQKGGGNMQQKNYYKEVYDWTITTLAAGIVAENIFRCRIYFSFGLERKWDCNPCIPDEHWEQENFSMPSKLRNHRGSVRYQREYCSKVCWKSSTQGLNLYGADEGDDARRTGAQRKSSLHDTADTTDRGSVLRRADA